MLSQEEGEERVANIMAFGIIIRTAPEADDVVGAIGLLATRRKVYEVGVEL